MKKNISLIRAVMSEDMNPFKVTNKHNNLAFLGFMAILVMFAAGYYAYLLAEPLASANLTFIIPTLFIFLVTILLFMEGIYKSQGILFDAKDNDLLFSLPISKGKILFVRILKLLVFQFIFAILFLVPSLIVYAYFDKPSIGFYFISLLFIFLIPIVPTVLSSIVGYAIKHITSRFKAKKIVQTILTFCSVLLFMILMFNMENILKGIMNNANSINDILIKIYYPAGAFLSLINNFKIITLLKVLLFVFIPLILFIMLGSVYYFKIISKSREINIYEKSKAVSYVRHNKMYSLLKKEFSRYFNTPVYMLNTLFGVIAMFLITIYLGVKGNSILTSINIDGMGIPSNFLNEYLPLVYIGLIMFTGFMTFITASSISLEGKGINITKSLPLRIEDIFKSKIYASNLIVIPLMVISAFIFVIRFKVSLVYTISIILLVILVPTLMALIGLLINLKYPKLDFSSDTEVVKQSMSTMICSFLGMFLCAVSIGLMVYCYKNIELFLLIYILVIGVMIVVVWRVIKKYGIKMFQRLSI